MLNRIRSGKKDHLITGHQSLITKILSPFSIVLSPFSHSPPFTRLFNFSSRLSRRLSSCSILFSSKAGGASCWVQIPVVSHISRVSAAGRERPSKAGLSAFNSTDFGPAAATRRVLTSNASLAKLAGKSQKDVLTFVKVAETGSREGLRFSLIVRQNKGFQLLLIHYRHYLFSQFIHIPVRALQFEGRFHSVFFCLAG